MFKREFIVELKARDYRPRAWADYISSHLRLAVQVMEDRPAAVRSVIGAAIGLFVLAFVSTLALSLVRADDLGRRVFVAAIFWLAGQTLWILFHLGLLVDLAERPVPRLGLPNILTLLRGITVPALIILAGAGELELVLIVYALGAISDVADGALARRIGPSTRLGVVMDPVVDIAWNAAAIVALERARLLPQWAVVLVLLRYGLLIGGSTWLYLRNTAVRIRSTRFGKASGMIMSSAILLVLLNAVAVPERQAAAVRGLLEVAIGFLLWGTIAHVLALGVLNFRAPERAQEPVGRVVGHIQP